MTTMEVSTPSSLSDDDNSHTGSSDSSTVMTTTTAASTSTSALSSSASASSSASRAASHETPTAPPRASPMTLAAAAAKVVTNRGPELGGTSSSAAARPGRMRLNPTLRFERADNEYIPMPPLRDMQNIATVLRRLVLDRERYPEGRHRMLDYFRVAIEMFVAQLRAEYVQQHQSARRNGKPLVRFTWKNKGELAICFACCCDMLKLLYDALQPGPLKPLWDAFVQQLFPLLISESGVPATVLTVQTYHTKYMDWQKGGTRYSGDQSTTNVRFPSAQERRAKIETYLRSGSGYRLEAVTVDPNTLVEIRSGQTGRAATTTSSTSTTVAPGVLLQVKSVAGRPLHRIADVTAPGTTTMTAAGRPSSLVQPPRLASAAPQALASSSSQGALLMPRPPAPRPFAKGTPLLAPLPNNAAATTTSGSAATPAIMGVAARTPPELRHLQWLSLLAHIKGDEATAAFPDHRAQTMPGFVRLCEMTERRDEMLMLTDIVAASSAAMQGLFERLGGVVCFRRFASQAIQAGDGKALMHIVEQVARLRVPSWGAISQQAWRTNMSQRLTGDLNWLRTEAIIPAEKRAAWGALILLMEQKYIFRTPRSEDGTDDSLKRQRDEGEMGAAIGDNFDIQRWKLPRVNTLLAVRLPSELRAPPLSSALEENMTAFLNAKRRYVLEAQRTWQKQLQTALQAQHVDVDAYEIPLWYDPCQLLGVNPLT